MSYSYTPPTGQPGQIPPNSTTYPYGTTYIPPTYTAYGHPPTPGATFANPYGATGAYQSGVTTYGWPYQYSYIPQHTQPGTTTGAATKPASTQPLTSGAAPIAGASTVTSLPAPPQRSSTTTFSTYTPYGQSQSHARETVAAAATGGASGRGRKQANFKGMFTKELKSLMYGFGDDRNPANDTVNVLEEILVEYITDVCQCAGGSSRKSRLSIEDLRRVLSRPADAKKLARMEELLFMQEDIKRARAQFEDSEMSHPGGGKALAFG